MWALATLSGCLNGAAFVFYGPLALIANLPLLFALRAVTSLGEAVSLGAWVGFLGGVHIFGVLNYGWWIFWAFSFYTASQMTLFGAVIYIVRRFISPQLPYALRLVYELLTPAIIWTLTEWLRTVGPVALPASYVGCLADISWFTPLLGWSSVMGGLGVSALVALVSSSIWMCLSAHDIEAEIGDVEGEHSEEGERDTKSRRSRQSEEPAEEREARLARQRIHLKATRAFTGLGGLLIIVGIYTWGYLSPPSVDGDPLKIAGLQGGFTNEFYQATEADPRLSVDVVETYETLVKEARAQGVDLMVWAESALRVPIINTPELRQRLLPQSDQEPWLIGGLAHMDSDGREYNLAFSAHDQRVIGRYEKVKTVPGVEARFTPGEEWRPLPTKWGAVGVLICFESIYPHAGRALAQAGARLMIVLSNDAGFGETPISHHMTNRAIVRAVETGRWLLRVGQAGVTTLIDPQGHQHGQLKLFEAGILYGEAKLRGAVTPFVRFGVSWLWSLVLFLIAPVIYVYLPLLLRSWRESRTRERSLSSPQFSRSSSSLPALFAGKISRTFNKINTYVRAHLKPSHQSEDTDEDSSKDDDPYA